MGAVAKEKGLLKLVHPGRHVEIHTKPKTAAEVLKKNPRHSITRPDVFKYPWIVVKPESVLDLGKVFFVVPNRTIYHLLKAHRNGKQHSPRQSHSPKKHVHKQVQIQNLLRKSNAGMTPKHPNHHKGLDPSFHMTCIGTTSQKQDEDKRLKKQSKSWLSVIPKCKNASHEFEKKSVEDATIKFRPSHQEEYHFLDTDVTAEFAKNNSYVLQFKSSKEVNTLKSCLRKPNSIRKLRQFRVSFVLPVKDEEEPRSIKAFQTQFAGCYSSSCTDSFFHSTHHIPT